MALVDDIQSYMSSVQKNPFATPNADDAVKTIDQQWTNNLVSQLAQLANKYRAATDNINQQIGTAKTEGQDTLNQNAVDEQKSLRNIREEMANAGNLAGGQTPYLMLQANTSRQNNDNKVYKQRQDDISKLNDQLSQLNSTGANDFQKLIADVQNQRSTAVQNQLAEEAKAAEQEREAELAAQSRIQAAQIAAAATRASAASRSSSSNSFDVNSVVSKLMNNYTAKNYDPTTGASYGTYVTDPSALLSAIDSMNISDAQKQAVMNAFPLRVGGGMTLSDYLNVINNPSSII